jgi:hypothetical protein
MYPFFAQEELNFQASQNVLLKMEKLLLFWISGSAS